MTAPDQEALIAAAVECIENLRAALARLRAAETAVKLIRSELAAARSPAEAARAAADAASARLDMLMLESRMFDAGARAVTAICHAADAGGARAVRKQAGMTWDGFFVAIAARSEAEQHLAEIEADRAPRPPARGRRRAPRTAR